MSNIDIDNIVYLILLSIKNTKYSKNLKIQKLIYIYEKEIGKGLFRKDFFKPHNFGPYSQRIWDIIDTLLSRKCILDNKTDGYKLTNWGNKLFKEIEQSNSTIDVSFFKGICKNFYDNDSNKMLKYVYNYYKEDLKKSIIIEDIIYEKGDYDWMWTSKQDIERLKNNFKNKEN